jgi:hypothetical protein
MKNRKSLFALAIVALVLVLGVGYAVVSSQTLKIENATASAGDTTLKVVYDGVNSGVTGKVTAITSADDSTTATFKIENMVLNETVAAEFEIKNKESDVNASIAVPTVTNSKSAYFDVKVYYQESSGSYAEWTTAHTLNAQATAKVKVEVTLKATPINAGDDETTITVTYVASPAA